MVSRPASPWQTRHAEPHPFPRYTRPRGLVPCGIASRTGAGESEDEDGQEDLAGARARRHAATCFAAGAVAAKQTATTDPRPRTVTKGLDYFHARQKADGGFGTMAATAWVILGAVASGERIGSTMWTVGGNNPFGYLQANSHEAAATGPDVDNAPVYYAQAIMAYVAADRAERVFVAGTPRVDLLAKLYCYQDIADGSPTKGSFSPATSSRKFQAVHTTAWAILAMQAMGDDEKDRFALAEQWLATQQLADGGFPAQAGQPSNCEDTALAIQALSSPRTSPSTRPSSPPRAVPQGQPARRRRLPVQAPAAAPTPGPPRPPSRPSSPWARSPTAPTGWSARTRPSSALATLQRTNGAYAKKRGDATGPLPTTSWALVALRDKPFTTFPATRPRPSRPSSSARRSKSVPPKDGQSTRPPARAHPRHVHRRRQGHGHRPHGVPRLRRRRERPSRPTSARYRLHLQLKNVPNGIHTYRLEIVDHAGNVKKVERTLHGRRPDAAHADAHLHPDPGAPLHTAARSSSPRRRRRPRPTPYPTLTPSAYPSP